MNEFVLAEQNNDVLEIILNRTAKKNALTLSMYEQLTQLLDSASENPEINVGTYSSRRDKLLCG